jgi:hypothetical protein
MNDHEKGDLQSKAITVLDLTLLTRNQLRDYGIFTLADLCAYSAQNLKDLLGKKSFLEIKCELNARDLSLYQDENAPKKKHVLYRTHDHHIPAILSLLEKGLSYSAIGKELNLYPNMVQTLVCRGLGQMSYKVSGKSFYGLVADELGSEYWRCRAKDMRRMLHVLRERVARFDVSPIGQAIQLLEKNGYVVSRQK